MVTVERIQTNKKWAITMNDTEISFIILFLDKFIGLQGTVLIEFLEKLKREWNKKVLEPMPKDPDNKF